MADHQFAVPLESIPVGVSACLLGAKVRFDGGHKRDAFIDQVLGRYFRLLPFCPEVAVGMGTPRPPIRLVGTEDAPRALGTRDPGLDYTLPLRAYGERVGHTHRELCGFILKKGSPSCGLERVKIYTEQGMPHAHGSGLFAAELMRTQPLLPVEEEGRLHDPVLRENFITRVYVYARWRAFEQQGFSKAGLIDFHARHKLVLMAHNPQGYRELGRRVARVGLEPLADLAGDYIARLMELLCQRATRNRHVNVLQHLTGYLRGQLDEEDRAELHDSIQSYRRGDVPLVVPMTMLQHHFRRHPHSYIERQVYLQPHPRELGLRNAL